MLGDFEAVELDTEKGSSEQSSLLHTLIAQHANLVNSNGIGGHTQEEGLQGKNYLAVKEVVETSKKMAVLRKLNKKMDKNAVNMQYQAILKSLK